MGTSAHDPRVIALGQELRRARRMQDLTLADVGGKMGIQPGTVSKHERGEVSPPLEKLLGYLDLYGLTLGDVAALIGQGPKGIGTAPAMDDEAYRRIRFEIGMDLVKEVIGSERIQRVIEEEREREAEELNDESHA